MSKIDFRPWVSCLFIADPWRRAVTTTPVHRVARKYCKWSRLRAPHESARPCAMVPLRRQFYVNYYTVWYIPFDTHVVSRFKSFTCDTTSGAVCIWTAHKRIPMKVCLMWLYIENHSQFKSFVGPWSLSWSFIFRAK